MGQILEGTSTSRSDAVTYVASDLGIIAHESIHPTSMAETCRSDFTAISRIRRPNHVIEAVNRLSYVTMMLNNSFVLEAVRNLKSEDWSEKLASDHRDRMNKASGDGTSSWTTPKTS